MVEGTGLIIRRALTGLGGSNPPPSAITPPSLNKDATRLAFRPGFPATPLRGVGARGRGQRLRA